MTNIIKKNQKKLMAGFAVLLMISFVATIGGRPGGGGRTDVVVAHLGKTEVMDSQMQQAKDEWEWLTRTPVYDASSGRAMAVADNALLFANIESPPPQPQFDRTLKSDEALQNYIKAYRRMQEWEQVYGARFQMARTTAPILIDAFNHNPELFYILQTEAQNKGLGVAANDDRVNEYLKNRLGLDPATVPINSIQRGAVQGILTIAAESQWLVDGMKISQPAWQHAAAQAQSVRLNLIDFNASEYEKTIPAPTPQQLNQQFDRFKDRAPGENDPLAFGYQIPTRVKLQYMEIPRAQVIESVLRTIRPPGSAGDTSAGTDAHYDWAVQAALYYESHKEEFVNTPPATQPSTQPTTQAATTQLALTQPTTVATSLPAYKPFEDVKQEIIEKLAAAQIDQQARAIAADLASRLAEDYAAIQKTNPSAVHPTTVEATTKASVLSASPTPAGELMFLPHLEMIRADIDKKYGVAITLHDIGSDWQTTQTLAKLPGIGMATAGDSVPFSEYATSFARATTSAGLLPLQVWEPSQPLTDSEHNAYVFRLTAAQPAHAPGDVASVAKQVEQDWKLGQAYDQANNAAQKAYESAKTLGLAQVARTSNQKMTTTELFPPDQVEDVPGYKLPDPAATHQFLAAIQDLMANATPADKRPDKLVALPSAERIVVMELAGIQLNAPEWEAQIQVTEKQQQTRLQKLAQEWFNFDKIVARTQYKPVEKSS